MSNPPSSAAVPQALLELLYAQLRDHAIFEIDGQGLIRSWNRSGLRVLGHEEAAVLGQSFASLLHPSQCSPDDLASLLSTAQSNGRGEKTLSFVRRNGQGFQGYTVLVPVPDGGFAVVVRDLSILQATQEQLHALATIDQMTGLANRQHMIEMGRIEYRRFKRYKVPLSLILLQIDSFAALTAQLRPEELDALLCDVADILKQCVRELDMVAHLEGGYFTCLLPNTAQEGAAVLAERIRSHLAKAAFRLPGDLPMLTVSSVILTGSPLSIDFDTLLQQAYLALGETSRQGPNTITVV